MDSDYDYDDYNDAADDWELEAVEDEERQRQEEEERLRQKEKERPKRAPIVRQALRKEADEEVLDADVQAAEAQLKQIAGEIATAMSDITGGSSVKLLADTPITDKVAATELGAAIAERVLQLHADKHFATALHTIFSGIPQDVGTRDHLNAFSSTVSIAREKARKHQKEKGKGTTAAAKADESVEHHNPLDMDVVDRGGAEGVEESEQMF